MAGAKTDAVLNWKSGDLGVPFDFQIGSDGDIVTEDFLDTAILVSLFTDRRAKPHEVQKPQLRRGWIGDLETPEDPIGSTLWLLDQARMTPNTPIAARDAAKTGLDWMQRDGIAIAVKTRAFTEDDTLKLGIDITKPNSKSESVFVSLWDNTGR